MLNSNDPYMIKKRQKIAKLKSKAHDAKRWYGLDELLTCFERAMHMEDKVLAGRLWLNSKARANDPYELPPSYNMMPIPTPSGREKLYVGVIKPASPDVIEHCMNNAFTRYKSYIKLLDTSLSDKTTFANRQAIRRMARLQFDKYASEFDNKRRTARDFISDVHNDAMIRLGSPFETHPYEVQAVTRALFQTSITKEKNSKEFIDLLKFAIQFDWAEKLNFIIGTELFECVTLLQDMERLLDVLEDPKVFRSGTYPSRAVPVGLGTRDIAAVNHFYIDRYHQKADALLGARQFMCMYAFYWMTQAARLGLVKDKSASSSSASSGNESAPLDELIPRHQTRTKTILRGKLRHR